MGQESAQTKFAWTALILQLVFAVLFFLLVRYDHSADAKYVRDGDEHGKENLETVLTKYPSKKRTNKVSSIC